ncbi:MAG TPA: hypothetical protein VML55_21130 [Planctomycetaceae bacterium]|nr:hypothetical protein [Planctomycetaceae bacterium]
MTRLHTRTAVLAGALALAVTQFAEAQQQRGRGGRGGTVSQAELATLSEVQSDLKLTDEQKSKVAEINEKSAAEAREALQGASRENFAERREQLDKIRAEATSQLKAALDEAQQKRLREIWIQVAGTAALTDEDVAKELKLTQDQQRQIRQARRPGGQGGQDLSAEQRRERRREADQKTLAVLSAEQKEQFESMQGKKIEVDLVPLRQQQRPQRQRQT